MSNCGWCGDELVGKRSHAEYCDSSCRGKATLWRQGRPSDGEKALGSASPPPIQAIREEQETAKSRWSMTVREGVIDWFRQHPTGQFHADDLEPLGIPDEHRNVIGSQIAKLVNQKWIVECGRRKSVVPSRNGAKSNEYRLTERGVAGLGAGVPKPQGPGGAHLPVLDNASVEPGESVAEELEQAEDQLFEQPVSVASSSAFNPDNEYA